MTRAPQADIVIVAAGGSRRMAGVDKLDAPILGRPLLSWTVAQMSRAASLRRLVLVVAPSRLERYRRTDWLAGVPVEVVAGGAERSDSVRAGIGATDAPLVLVHDGARPLATAQLADAVADAAARYGAAVPILPLVDSVKRVTDGRVAGSVERTGLGRAQTPQGARRELLLAAYAGAGDEAFSDEAALLESRGIPVATVDGEPANVKVTDARDLELVRTLFAGQAPAADVRTGLGQDSHPFGPADGLWLGGILIEEAPRLYGHSDGDVLLHALASALLAAAGLGDLGRHFPAGEPQTADIPSAHLLAAVLDMLAGAGWQSRSVQLSLLGARPRLGAARLEQMRLRIADLLGLDGWAVSLTASSGNLTGPEGAGLAISATASATIGRA